MRKPLVSWLVPTTLHRHNWWGVLAEFLEDDFPADESECIFLGIQDQNFEKEAREIGERVFSAFSFLPNATDKWKRVRFVEKYEPTFNIALCRNLLLEEAQGEIVIYRDADTALLKPNFTSFAIEELMRSRYGLMSFPSLSNGRHFKPKSTLITKPDPRYDSLTLACTVNGMATIALKSIFRHLGGWNNSMKLWGEHTALCTKMARAGFLMGYSDTGYWLTTEAAKSKISLTDDSLNPSSLKERIKGCQLLRTFYKLEPSDVFRQVAQHDYGVSLTEINELADDLEAELEYFSISQQLDRSIDRFNFKPWGCLSHKDTPSYIANADKISRPFFDIIDKQILTLSKH